MKVPAILLTACLLVVGCSKASERLGDGPPHSGTTAPNRALANQVVPEPMSTLADLLVQLPGVYVSHRGGNADVLVSGRNVAFIVDDVWTRFSYFEANMFVNPNDVIHVEILRGCRPVGSNNNQPSSLIHLHTRRKA